MDEEEYELLDDDFENMEVAGCDRDVYIPSKTSEDNSDLFRGMEIDEYYFPDW